MKNNTQTEIKEVSSSLKINSQNSKSRILRPIALLVLVATLAVCLATSASAALADTSIISNNIIFPDNAQHIERLYIYLEPSSVCGSMSALTGDEFHSAGFMFYPFDGMSDSNPELAKMVDYYNRGYYLGLYDSPWPAREVRDENGNSAVLWYAFLYGFLDTPPVYPVMLIGDPGTYYATLSGIFEGVSYEASWSITLPESGVAVVTDFVGWTGHVDVYSNPSADGTPVDPVVSDDFGGEVTYLRGQAATPLSVTATVTDGGTLSYQWYYIDSENVDVAVPIDGATGTSYTPDTRYVGSRYYYCIVTNTLGELTASMYSDYAYVTVTRPELGDGYNIYDYKDYVAGTVVDGTDKTYTITFPMSGICTELYGGFNGAYSFLDYYTGTDIFCDLPTSAQGDETFNARLDFYPLGMGSQYNVLKLRNIAQGIPAAFVFAVDFDADMYCAAPVLTFYWYDEDMSLIGSTDQDLSQEIDTDGCTWYSTAWDFTYPGSAVYCAYCVSVPDFGPEENMDFNLEIVTTDLVLTFSMMEDISGSIGEVGDKIDGVGDKIEQVGGEIIDGIGETNDKLDDLITGGEAGDSATDSSDALKDKTDEAGSAIGNYKDTMDSLPEVPDNIGGVLNDDDINISIDVMGGIMNWEQSGLVAMYAPMTMVLAVAFLCYVVFGKRG